MLTSAGLVLLLLVAACANLGILVLARGVPYTMAMALFAAVVALSILAPGRRATRINPSRALQHE